MHSAIMVVQFYQTSNPVKGECAELLVHWYSGWLRNVKPCALALLWSFVSGQIGDHESVLP